MTLPETIPEVTEVEVIGRYQLRLTFDDGLVREMDFTDDLWGETSEPLKDPDYFARVRVEDGTIIWPNEVDYDPVTLHGDEEPCDGSRVRLISEYVRDEARHFKYDRPRLWAIIMRLKSWSWGVRWRLRELRHRIAA